MTTSHSLTNLFALGLGGQELWIVLIVILILFGGKKIPELMRGVGRGVGELQKGVDEGRKAFESSKNLDTRDSYNDPEPAKTIDRPSDSTA